MNAPDWQWNEIQQVGTDYTDLTEVEKYDARMATFRDVDGENRKLLATLNLEKGSTVLEIGCGTGRFARAAAAAGMRVSVADVSPIMLEYVAAKAKEEGLSEIVAQHAGFLTMDFPAESFDAVVSGAALHHLPDAWKLVGLQNIAKVLRPGGQLILCDVVFALGDDNSPAACFEAFASGFPNMREEAARHVATEYSTYDWIMEGLLARAGFDLLSTEFRGDSFIVYHCRNGA